MLSKALHPHKYFWPQSDLRENSQWKFIKNKNIYEMTLPEDTEILAKDSQWPAFFPAPMCFVTTAFEGNQALEKVVGASIVNRFPYVLALSFCKKELSDRHYCRQQFTETLERSQGISVQYLPIGNSLNRVMNAISSTLENKTFERLEKSGLTTREGITNASPVFEDAYMVYEGRLAKPGKDFDGKPIFEKPWLDAGSHRVYFFEINLIQLRQDIAKGQSQICWQSLPTWKPSTTSQGSIKSSPKPDLGVRYQKGYTPHYKFPSLGTIAFEADTTENGMAIKHLPPLPEDQVEVDNDRARWPCFFPSSVGMITSWTRERTPNLMPCGSTTIISRNPFIITPCVSYAAINERYSPRKTLGILRESGKFSCGIPYIDETVIDAIRYAGNISLSGDPKKVANAGLPIEDSEWAPICSSLPIHFDCKVVDEIRLGTHIMFIGEVLKIRVRADVTVQNRLEWVPWPEVRNNRV